MDFLDFQTKPLEHKRADYPFEWPTVDKPCLYNRGGTCTMCGTCKDKLEDKSCALHVESND